MVNNSEIIDKKTLCNAITPELITDLVNVVWYAEDNGWRDTEDAKKLQTEIEKIGSFCNIVEIKDRPSKTYAKKV